MRNISISMSAIWAGSITVISVVASSLIYLHSTFMTKSDLEEFGKRIILETRQEMLMSRDILIRNLERELLDVEFQIESREKDSKESYRFSLEHLIGKKKEISILLKKIEGGRK